MAGALRVLVVEDDPNLRKLTMFALGLDGELDVETCGSGEEALERIAARRPDVVLLDLELPGIGGLELTRRIAPLPVVIMTGKPKVELGDAVIRGLIKKPFDPTTLASELRRLV